MRLTRFALGVAGLALLVSACTTTTVVGEATVDRSGHSGKATDTRSGPAAFAYATAGGLTVMRGREVLAAVDTDGAAVHGEWAADGTRFVAATAQQLISVDLQTGKAVTAGCTCWSIALAANKVYVLPEYGATDLAAFDAASLQPAGSLRPKGVTGHGMLQIAGAADRIVSFAITAEGARPLADVTVVDPSDGSSTVVGNTGQVGLPTEVAYTPTAWDGKPKVAYIASGSTGASTATGSVVWLDPVHPRSQVVTGDQELRRSTPDVSTEDWNSGRDNLWWAADGTLHTSAWTWTCTTDDPLAGPQCGEQSRHTQWRYDGENWLKVDDVDLSSRRDTGGGLSLVLARPVQPGGEQRLLFEENGERSRLSDAVRQLWTAPVAAEQPANQAVTVVDLNAAMGYKLKAGDDRGTEPTPEDLGDLADDILRQDADIANLQEMAKPAALELQRILAGRTGRRWDMNWAHSSNATYYLGKDKHEGPAPGYDNVSAGNAQLIRIGAGIRSQRSITTDDKVDQGILLHSGKRSFEGTAITADDGTVVNVYVAHLARPQDADEDARIKDAQQLWRYMDGHGGPIVLTGDFNETIETGPGDPYPTRTAKEIRRLITDGGYDDIGRDLGPTSNQKGPAAHIASQLRIDFILTRDTKTRDTARFVSHQSDHWGLVTTLDL